MSVTRDLKLINIYEQKTEMKKISNRKYLRLRCKFGEIGRKHAGAELGQAQLKLGLGFTSTNFH